jgi:hypothetical protein
LEDVNVGIPVQCRLLPRGGQFDQWGNLAFYFTRIWNLSFLSFRRKPESSGGGVLDSGFRRSDEYSDFSQARFFARTTEFHTRRRKEWEGRVEEIESRGIFDVHLRMV